MDLEMLPLNQLFFNFNARRDIEDRYEKEAVEEKKEQHVSSKYDDDVAALKERFGELENRTIEITLAEMLEIIPKQRRRADAYNGLIKWLFENKKTNLIIKTKNYGKKED